MIVSAWKLTLPKYLVGFSNPQSLFDQTFGIPLSIPGAEKCILNSVVKFLVSNI